VSKVAAPNPLPATLPAGTVATGLDTGASYVATSVVRLMDGAGYIGSWKHEERAAANDGFWMPVESISWSSVHAEPEQESDGYGKFQLATYVGCAPAGSIVKVAGRPGAPPSPAQPVGDAWMPNGICAHCNAKLSRELRVCAYCAKRGDDTNTAELTDKEPSQQAAAARAAAFEKRSRPRVTADQKLFELEHPWSNAEDFEP